MSQLYQGAPRTHFEMTRLTHSGKKKLLKNGRQEGAEKCEGRGMFEVGKRGDSKYEVQC